MNYRGATSRAPRAGSACLVLIALAMNACDGRPGAAVPDLPPAATAAAQQLDRLDVALTQGDIVSAEALAEQLHAEGLRHPRLAYIRGRLAERRGDQQQAEAAYHEAIATAPRWFEPKAALASYYLRQQRLTSAQALFHDLDQLFAHHPIGPFGLGQVALRGGHIEQATDYFLTALERDRDYPPALLGLAEIRQRQQDREAARGLLGRYLTHVPDNASAWNMLGEIHQADGRLGDARAAYQRALALRPSDLLRARIAEIDRQLPSP